jgi:hypothetical protein
MFSILLSGADGPRPVAAADWRRGGPALGVTVTRDSPGTSILNSSLLEFGSNTQRVGDTGLLLEATSQNENTNPRSEGAAIGVIGAGGAVPTGYAAPVVISGLTLEVVALPMYGSVQAVRYRLFGTPSATGNNFIRVTSNSTSTSGTFAGTCWYRVVAGSLAGFVASQVLFQGQAGNTAFAASPTLVRIGHTAVIATTRAATINLPVTSGTPVDVTLDVLAGQMEATAPTSVVLPANATLAASTRAAETASLFVPGANRTVRLLRQDLNGFEWSDASVVGNSIVLEPRAGQDALRRVRVFEVGQLTAAQETLMGVAA